ncbi:MAG: HEAT repeat domain-containing protein [Methanomicrobiales archaeon]|nr:HEAT repeat domain-containing protein [Methanomicrobiales archaeon]
MSEIEELQKLLSSPVRADRKRAAQLLAEGESSDLALASLWSLLGDPDKTVRAAASDALACHGEGAIPLLRKGLEDPDWVIRYRSVEALGRMEIAGVEDIIVGMLKDPREHVRYMAAKSLLNRVPPSAIDLLKACLRDDNVYVRTMAVAALASSNSGEAKGALMEHLYRESSEEIRSRIRAYLRVE